MKTISKVGLLRASYRWAARIGLVTSMVLLIRGDENLALWCGLVAIYFSVAGLYEQCPKCTED